MQRRRTGMATTTKGGRGKKVEAKARSKTQIKSRGGTRTKIGKPASEPRHKKVKARPGVAESGAGLVAPEEPPIIDSAVGIADRTIRLSWHYAYDDSPELPVIWPNQRFHIRRKNLTFGGGRQLDILVPHSDSHHYTFDDIGDGTMLTRLEPGASYEYRIAANVIRWEGIIEGTYSDPVIGTTPNTPFQPTFEASLLNDSEGWQGRCLVQRIEGGQLKQSGAQVQLTLRASSVSGAFID